MKKHIFFSLLVLIFLIFFNLTNEKTFLINKVSAQSNKTIVNSEKAKKMLIGKHRLQLQWLSFWSIKEMGSAEIIEKDGLLFIEGKQNKKDDFLEISGNILEINEKDFLFNGKISMRVNYNNEGKVCKREGKMLFRISGQRKFWRLKDMLNPCDNTTTDYIDIFFKDK
ncbi:MAG: hypothetical protein HY819_06050 [Acidobacteria bacterium]|nr:hypothetical protein [Acidobacteriota bacterium]